MENLPNRLNGGLRLPALSSSESDDDCDDDSEVSGSDTGFIVFVWRSLLLAGFVRPADSLGAVLGCCAGRLRGDCGLVAGAWVAVMGPDAFLFAGAVMH